MNAVLLFVVVAMVVYGLALTERWYQTSIVNTASELLSRHGDR